MDGQLGLTRTGVEGQVGNLSAGPLQLGQNHGTHCPALLVGPLSLGPAPAPQVNAAVHVVLGGWGTGTTRMRQGDARTRFGSLTRPNLISCQSSADAEGPRTHLDD